MFVKVSSHGGLVLMLVVSSNGGVDSAGYVLDEGGAARGAPGRALDGGREVAGVAGVVLGLEAIELLGHDGESAAQRLDLALRVVGPPLNGGAAAARGRAVGGVGRTRSGVAAAACERLVPLAATRLSQDDEERRRRQDAQDERRETRDVTRLFLPLAPCPRRKRVRKPLCCGVPMPSTTAFMEVTPARIDLRRKAVGVPRAAASRIGKRSLRKSVYKRPETKRGKYCWSNFSLMRVATSSNTLACEAQSAYSLTHRETSLLESRKTLRSSRRLFSSKLKVTRSRQTGVHPLVSFPLLCVN